jgi:hypothetical protein
MSMWKAIREPILLLVSFYMISVTKLWNMIIRVYMCKGGKYLAKVLVSTMSFMMTNKLHSASMVSVKWESTNIIGDEIE